MLRHRLGFTGAIFSDDLSMEAARHIDGRGVTFTEAALAALGAGGDMVLLCNQSVVDGGAPIDEAIEALSKALVQGDWVPSPASEERRQALLPQGPAMDWDRLMVSARYMQALSLIPDYRSTPSLSSRSEISSSRSIGLSSAINRCLSSAGAGSSSAQRLATQPLSSPLVGRLQRQLVHGSGFALAQVGQHALQGVPRDAAQVVPGPPRPARARRAARRPPTIHGAGGGWR